MKLCRYGQPGSEKPGLIDRDGGIRDLSGVVTDIGPAELSPAGLAKLRKLAVDSLPVVGGKPRFGPPSTGIGKYVAIGLNYVDHAKESNMPIPQEPIVFMKATSCIVGPNDDVLQPRHSTKLDWEVELGVTIGTRASYVSEADALSHVAGYCLCNDVSERAFQMQSSQWDKGKGCDTFAPMGPCLVTADEVPHVPGLALWCAVNGQPMQRSRAADMIFDVAQLVSYVSQFMTLLAGDVISTGTPQGVGMSRKPPLYLKAGDIVECGIEAIGQLRQRVVAAS
jgi:2,4-diketo-3-deoxy-L-fuconate hydrolase